MIRIKRLITLDRGSTIKEIQDVMETAKTFFVKNPVTAETHTSLFVDSFRSVYNTALTP